MSQNVSNYIVSLKLTKTASIPPPPNKKKTIKEKAMIFQG